MAIWPGLRGCGCARERRAEAGGCRRASLVIKRSEATAAVQAGPAAPFRLTNLGMATGDQYGAGWTVVLPLQPVSIAAGRREGGYTAPGEIRCDCGDHPDLAYRGIFPWLQRIRGPYLIADGVTTYEIRRGPGPAARGGAPAGMTDVADRR